MTIKERFSRWLSFTRETLRPMSMGQRLGYLLYYYKGVIFGLLILALFIGYAVDAINRANKDIYIQGFFTNDECGFFSAEDIEREYSSVLSLEKNQSVVFDDDLYIDIGGEATEYTAASNGKLMAYMAVQELDFCVTCESVLHHYEEQTPMLDLASVLPEDMLAALEPYLYEYNGAYVALDMSACKFIAGSEYRDRASESYYIFIPTLAPHPDRTCDFIRWCFPELFTKN